MIHCNEVIDDNALYCPFCGEKIAFTESTVRLQEYTVSGMLIDRMYLIATGMIMPTHNQHVEILYRRLLDVEEGSQEYYWLLEVIKDLEQC